jgi:IS605 OrfB family transposase
MRRLLLLNVLPNHLNRRTATTSSKVAWHPKSAPAQLCLNGRVMLTANHPTRYLFHAIHSIGNGYLGGKFIGYVAMAKQLTEWRNGSETPWLKESPIHRHSRDALGEVRNVTVSQSGGKWFVSIQTRRDVDIAPPTGGIVHLDIGNARNDYLHKASAAISQNYAIVCIEDLQIRNMSKSSKGNTEIHGKKVSQKSGLNRSILDQGWGEFRRQLDYKLAWCGFLPNRWGCATSLQF